MKTKALSECRGSPGWRPGCTVSWFNQKAQSIVRICHQLLSMEVDQSSTGFVASDGIGNVSLVVGSMNSNSRFADEHPTAWL